MGDRFQEMLDLQRELQVEAFDVDPAGLQADAFADFIVWNAFALEDELHEVMGELKWKPWSDDRGRSEDTLPAQKEMADLMHFLLNICLALGLDSEKLSELYKAKRLVNIERQKIGYTKARAEGL